MKVKRIEHVGIVVRDVEASRKLWEGCFGIPLAGTEDNATRRLALYPVGDSMVELIAGLTPDSKQAKLIAAGKGGLNHVCLEVEDIDDALVAGLGVAADDDGEVGVGGAEIDELAVEGGDLGLLLVEEDASLAVHGDVVGLAGRVLLALGGAGEAEVEVVDDGGGGDDEDDEEDEGEVEERGDVELRERVMVALGAFFHGGKREAGSGGRETRCGGRVSVG